MAKLQSGFLGPREKSSCLSSGTDIPTAEALSDPEKMLQWLVVRGSPRWESWCMKSDVGFDPSIKGNGRPKYLFNWLRPDSEIGSISELPMVQADVAGMGMPKQEEGGIGFSKTKPSQVAAVLFNQPAAETLYESSLTLGEPGWTPPHFPEGALIVKVIWDLSPWNPDTKGYWFLPVIKLWLPAPPPPQDIEITGIFGARAERSYPTIDDSVRPLHITESRGATCGQILGDTIDEDCLHWHPITAWNINAHISANKNDQQAQCANQGCSAILVGFHVMAKSGPAVDDWTFMTFWLVQGETENRFLSAPWRYFTSNSVKTPRGQFSTRTGYENNLCFNPYLEPRVVKYGQTSNCVDCHHLAAYQASVSYKQAGKNANTVRLRNEYSQKLSLFTQGNCLGARPLDPEDAARIALATKQYVDDKNHATTNRVWSLATKLLSINSPNVKTPEDQVDRLTCQIQPAQQR